MGEPASNERVTMAVLSSKLDTVKDTIDNLCTHYEVDSRQIAVNTHRLTSLEMRQLPCVMHEGMVKKLDDVRLDVARISVQAGMAGGAGAGGVGVAVYVIGKLLKIW